MLGLCSRSCAQSELRTALDYYAFTLFQFRVRLMGFLVYSVQ